MPLDSEIRLEQADEGIACDREPLLIRGDAHEVDGLQGRVRGTARRGVQRRAY